MTTTNSEFRVFTTGGPMRIVAASQQAAEEIAVKDGRVVISELQDLKNRLVRLDTSIELGNGDIIDWGWTLQSWANEKKAAVEKELRAVKAKCAKFEKILDKQVADLSYEANEVRGKAWFHPDIELKRIAHALRLEIDEVTADDRKAEIAALAKAKGEIADLKPDAKLAPCPYPWTEADRKADIEDLNKVKGAIVFHVDERVSKLANAYAQADKARAKEQCEYIAAQCRNSGFSLMEMAYFCKIIVSHCVNVADATLCVDQFMLRFRV